MKLALVTETYPPEVNGVAMTLHRLVSGLAARGHEIEVVRPRQDGEARIPGRERQVGRVTEWLVPGLPIPFYQTLKMGLPVWGALRRRWRAQPPGVVHVATEGPLGLAALRAARRLGLPVTSSFHTNFHHYGRHYGLNRLRDAITAYLRWFHNATALTMVPTDEIRAQLAAHGFARLAVMARGVDASLFSPARRRTELRASWGAGPDDPVFIHVGRLAAEKNLGLAVETFLLMQRIEPRARCILVGDGPARAALQKMYPQFHFAGMRRGEELAAHYASADVFIFPSTTETFGNVVTEAMASGLAVLAFDYAAARQHIVTGKNGLTVPLGEARAFTAAAADLLARRPAWPGLRTAARETALGITWERVVGQFEDELLRAHAKKSAVASAVALTASPG
ncbi:MAG TPA: glycosyltransferase family 1 protein [Opitutaceae bacterium]|nr:glycosyltransferase family 1 protein [Opitutaceae bacterium]